MQIRIRAAGVLSEKGKVLLVCHEKKGKRYMLLPGGGVESGETIHEALKREFLEETGIRVSVGNLLVINETVAPGGFRHGIHLTFFVKKISGKLKISPDKRLQAAGFVEWGKIPRISLRPAIGEILLKLFKENFKRAPVYLGNTWIPEAQG